MKMPNEILLVHKLKYTFFLMELNRDVLNEWTVLSRENMGY